MEFLKTLTKELYAYFTKKGYLYENELWKMLRTFSSIDEHPVRCHTLRMSVTEDLIGWARVRKIEIK